jgi:hypothetical protein
VVGDDAQAGDADVVCCASQLGGAGDERREQVGLEVRDFALQHGGDALQAHTGIDRGPGQWGELVGGGLGDGVDNGRAVKLHEDQVPNLHVAGVVLAEGLVDARVLGGFQAHVVKNLRAGAAGAGLAHLPEVVLEAVLLDASLGHAGVDPEILGLGVAGHAVRTLKDGDVEALFGDAQPLRAGDQFPGEGNHFVLEVVAEAEVAQHLKEGVVAARKANVFKVVVLAARADALLRSGGALVVALLRPQEHVFELVHPGVGEQKRRVVGGHQ